MVPYADRTFPTPSGKFQFMTAFDPGILPVKKAQYPYHLLSFMAHDCIGSEQTLSEHSDLPQIRMHPAEGEIKSLAHGDLVEVRSPVGAIRARLVLDPLQRRDTVAVQRSGWIKAGHGINRLTLDLSSKVGDGTPYNETCVDVFPVAS
jgi:anaerobic selenocysteine-containing dehydrogenase